MATVAALDHVMAWAVDQAIDTPALLLSTSAIRAGVAHLREQLGGRVSYSTKANPHPVVVQELIPLVDEFNVTNLVHLDDLLGFGVEPSCITYVHPVMTAATLHAAVERGITRFVADDVRGVRLLAAAGGELRVTLRLLPPDIGEATRSVVRFGNTHDALREVAVEAVDAGLAVEGVSFFVGTAGDGMAEAVPFRTGIEQLAKLHADLDMDGITVPTVNIGGGFPGSRRRFHLEHPDFLARIRKIFAEQFPPEIQLLSEPGRFLAEPSMAVLTRVVADRTIAGRRMVYVDASAYGGLFESSFIEADGPDPMIWWNSRQAPARPAAVLGPIMDSFDVVKRDVQLPPLEAGQLLLVPNIGAYSWGYMATCEGVATPPVVELPEDLDAELGTAWYE
jgi:ornithine decarboxylase